MDNGINEEELIASLSKSIPGLAKKAQKMFFGGWSPKEVLNIFSKDKEVQKTARRGLKPVTPSEMASMHLRNSYNNVPKSSGQESLEKMSDFTRKAAPLAIGAIASPLAGNVINSALQRALPQNDRLTEILGNRINTQPQMPTQQITPNQTTNAAPLQPPVNQVEPTLPQPVNIQQPEEKTNITDVLWNDLEKNSGKKFGFESDAFLKIARRMKSTGEIRSKEDFQRFFQLFEQKKNEGKDLPAALRESSQEFDMERLTPENQVLKNEKLVDEGVKEPATAPEPVKIEKNSVVSSPNGIGEIKSIKEKTALVDIDGKLTKVNIEDLESEPPDIADLYDNLFNAIPKEYQSRMMNYAGYDEDANELIFRPHGGAAYVYKNIPPQFAEDLKNRLHNAKTTGKNMYGMWNEGDPSYGAGMSALIKELQKAYGGKGKEYVRKYNTLFDILGIPHEEKKRKEQEERRKRKANG